MGGAFSAASTGLYVCTHRSVYLPGELVEGVVCLNVADPAFTAVALKVALHGVEETSWTEKRTETVQVHRSDRCPPEAFDGSAQCHTHVHAGEHHGMHVAMHTAHVHAGHSHHHHHTHCGAAGPAHHGCHTNAHTATTTTNTRTVREYRRGRSEFLQAGATLYSWGGGYVAPGQYQFPFRFQLPLNVPSSLTLDLGSHGSSYEDVRAEICYRIKAEVMRPGMLQCNVRAETGLTVRQAPYPTLMGGPPRPLVAEDVTGVSSCCCFSKGCVSVRAVAPKNTFEQGETASLALEVDNNTQLAFPKVTVTVVRHLQLHASGATFRREHDVLHRSCAGLPKGASWRGGEAQQVLLSLPADLLPTTNTHLVHCTYTLVVELSAGATTNNPRARAPLIVYDKLPYSMGMPHGGSAYGVPYGAAPPEWWRPTVVGVPVDIAGSAASAAPVSAINARAPHSFGGAHPRASGPLGKSNNA